MERTAPTTESASVGSALRVALVANAGSRGCDPDACADRLRTFGAEVEPFAIDELERAVAAGADRLVVAGGDGSIAPVAAAAGRSGTPLALLPAGTGHHVACHLDAALQARAGAPGASSTRTGSGGSMRVVADS